jgi:RNase P/RNase MRP subunit p30
MNFHVKKGTIEAAIKKEIYFELTYADSFEDHETKRILFSNCVNLINNLKGKNIIFSSGTYDNFLHRSPFDIASLYFFNLRGVVLGLKPDVSQNTLSKNPLKCI